LQQQLKLELEMIAVLMMKLEFINCFEMELVLVIIV